MNHARKKNVKKSSVKIRKIWWFGHPIGRGGDRVVTEKRVGRVVRRGEPLSEGDSGYVDSEGKGWGRAI